MNPEKKATIAIISILSVLVVTAITHSFPYILLFFCFNLFLGIVSIVWGCIAIAFGSEIQDPVEAICIVFETIYIKPFRWIKEMIGY